MTWIRSYSWDPPTVWKPWADRKDSCSQSLNLSSGVGHDPRAQCPAGIPSQACAARSSPLPGGAGALGKSRSASFEGKGQGMWIRKPQVAAKCGISVILLNVTKYSGKKRSVSSSHYLEMRILAFKRFQRSSSFTLSFCRWEIEV